MDLDEQAARICGKMICSHCKGRGSTLEGYITIHKEECDCSKYKKIIPKGWSPSTRWDHAGILIEWAENNGSELRIITNIDECIGREVYFLPMNDELNLIHLEPEEPLTPLHITQAFVKALGKESEE